MSCLLPPLGGCSPRMELPERRVTGARPAYAARWPEVGKADYTLVSSFSELEEALKDLAANLCDVSVTVTKESDDATPGVFVPRPGWKFSGRVELQSPGQQFNYAWIEPNAVDSVDAGSATQTGTTAAAGTVRFDWRPTAAGALSTIDVSEDVPTG